MRFFFDHNMSPAIPRALQELFALEHEIVSLREKFPQDIPDVDWIKALSQEGHWIIVSGDRRITRNKAEYQAFRNSKLTGFFLSPGLAKTSVIKQTERILALWNPITTIASTVQPGAMYELPMKSSLPRQI